MDDDTKKKVLIGVVIGCIILAVVVFLITRSDGGGDIKEVKGLIWMKCRNPECEAEYQIDRQEYYEFVQTHLKPMALDQPPMTCEKCGEPSAYAATKCPKCGTVFETGSVPNAFPDKCPKCGYSETEKLQKPRRKRSRR